MVLGLTIFKKYWKQILCVLLFIIMIPIMIASSFTVYKTTPAIDSDTAELYINAASAVNSKYHVNVDWRDMISIDAVRYNQDFSQANSSNVNDLAMKFVKVNKKVTKYDLSNFHSRVDHYNKTYGINIDWRYVVQVYSVFNKELTNVNVSTIDQYTSDFIKCYTISETYNVPQTVSYKVSYKVWVPWIEWLPWFGGRYVTKYKTVKKTIYIKKVKYSNGYKLKNIADVLIDLGHSTKEIPDFFHDLSKININMTKTDITYSTKSLDDVIAEFKFSDSQITDIKNYRNVGLEAMYDNSMCITDIDQHSDISNSDFLKQIKDGAIKTQKEYGVYASISIAQAIIESGWGKSMLAEKYNNLFGIKAYNWSGPSAMMPTSEDENGTHIKITAPFRVYSSWADSIEDHGKFLVQNSVYKNAGVFSSKDYIEQAFALKKAGYATESNYAIMLINCINQYNLNQYDKQ